MRQRNTGEAVTSSPFITVNLLEGNAPGITRRTQLDETTEEVYEDRISVVRVQAYGSGAMTILYRLRAYFGSSPGMMELKKIGVALPSIDVPKDVSAAVLSGFEERAVMNCTITYADIYRIEQDTIAEVEIGLITDNPQTKTEIIVISPQEK